MAFLSHPPLLPHRPRPSLTTRRPSTCAAQDPNADLDIVERAVQFFFGAKQAAPFGLARFDRDRFPELYTATLDEFAAPVDGDCDDAVLFRPLLARTQLEKRPVQLMFDAERDGWSAEKFHEMLDRKGASVGIMATEGATFGMCVCEFV